MCVCVCVTCAWLQLLSKYFVLEALILHVFCRQGWQGWQRRNMGMHVTVVDQGVLRVKTEGVV